MMKISQIMKNDENLPNHEKSSKLLKSWKMLILPFFKHCVNFEDLSSFWWFLFILAIFLHFWWFSIFWWFINILAIFHHFSDFSWFWQFFIIVQIWSIFDDFSNCDHFCGFSSFCRFGMFFWIFISVHIIYMREMFSSHANGKQIRMYKK